MADQYFKGRRVSASVYSILMEAERRQQKHHLRVDGKVGPKTASALRRRYGWRVWSRRRRHKC